MAIQNNLFEELINKIKNLDIDNDEKKEIIKLTTNIKKLAKKEKKIKDPNAPKRPKNGFMLFMDDIRKIKKNEKYSNNFPSDKLDDIKILINENNSITELSKACGNFWKNADNNIKSKYEIAYKKSK